MTQKNLHLRHHTPLLFIILLLIGAMVLAFGGNSSVAAPPAESVNNRGAANTSPLAPLANWTPPDDAYRVYIGPGDSVPNRVHNYVGLDGIYELDYDYLQAAGLPVETLDPRSFRMFYMGQEIAIQVEGEADGSFDPGDDVNPADAVLFFGQSVDSLFDEGVLPTNKYTEANVYFLSYGGDDGLRMAEPDGAPAGDIVDVFIHPERQETSLWYFSARPFEHDADHWFWDWLQPQGLNIPTSRSYSFSAPNVATGANDGALTVNMLGYFNGPHHLRLYINDNLVFDDGVVWSDFDPLEITVPVSAAYFQDPNNIIRFEMFNQAGKYFDIAYINWFRVSYPDSLVAENNELLFNNQTPGAAQYQVDNFSSDTIEVYDASDLYDLRRFMNTTITGAGPYAVSFGDTVAANSRYIALSPAARRTPLAIEALSRPGSLYTPPDLLDVTNEADYIIITHADFWSEAVQLGTYRSQRYRVAVVDAQQIYDQFNGGLMSAESIHDFLAYAHSNWTSPAPMFVVLYGDGTSDMRNYMNPKLTFIPPYLLLADIDLGETAVQNRFVTLTGDDILPDMHIGRLPANTPEEAESIRRKIFDYEVQCECNGWNYNTLFVADDLEGGGGNFREYSDQVADGYFDLPDNTSKIVPTAYTINKTYLGDTCDIDLPLPGEEDISVECRQEIIDTLNGPGALFVSYVGHATKTNWAVERLLDASALDEVDNASCLPLMIAMTCLEGSFHDPVDTALGEYSVTLPYDGAIASWSPTGFGLVTGHDVLEQGLMLALLHDGVSELGAAITQAKYFLAEQVPSGQYDDLLDTFVLLGDPGLKLKVDAVCSEIPTAVTLESPQTEANADGVSVSWRTVSETEVFGFDVWRRPQAQPSSVGPQAAVKVNSEFIFAQWSGAALGADYSFLDVTAAPASSFDYELEVYYVDGSVERYDAGSVTTFDHFYLPMVRGH